MIHHISSEPFNVESAMPRKSDKAGASSSRAAEALLASSGGFGGGNLTFGSSQVFKTEILEVDDTEINFCLKKMSKRDATTKTKALEEFAALCEQRTAADLVPILPAFVQTFGRLSLDNDKKVREALYRAFAAILKEVKKAITVHLKVLIPDWIIHMCDPFREVSRAARNLFEATFASPAKRRDVMIFCKTEFIDTIQENLKQTPSTLSDLRTTSADEADERWERVISASLAAQSAFVEYVCTPIVDESGKSVSSSALSASDLAAILSDSTLKFAASKHSIIRRSVYLLLKTFLLHEKNVVDSEISKIGPVIFASVAEQDISCHAAMWEILLLMLRNFPHAWQKINPQKHFFPKLWSTLKNASYGSPKTMYPCILPLLSCIPDSLFVVSEIPNSGDTCTANAVQCKTSLVAFFEKFCENIWLGLSAPVLGFDGSRHLISAFTECTVYCLQRLALFVSTYCRLNSHIVDSSPLDAFLCSQFDPLVSSMLLSPVDPAPEHEDAARLTPDWQHTPIASMKFIGKCNVDDVLSEFSGKLFAFFKPSSSKHASLIRSTLSSHLLQIVQRVLAVLAQSSHLMAESSVVSKRLLLIIESGLSWMKSDETAEHADLCKLNSHFFVDIMHECLKFCEIDRVGDASELNFLKIVRIIVDNVQSRTFFDVDDQGTLLVTQIVRHLFRIWHKRQLFDSPAPSADWIYVFSTLLNHSFTSGDESLRAELLSSLTSLLEAEKYSGEHSLLRTCSLVFSKFSAESVFQFSDPAKYESFVNSVIAVFQQATAIATRLDVASEIFSEACSFITNIVPFMDRVDSPSRNAVETLVRNCLHSLGGLAEAARLRLSSGKLHVDESLFSHSSMVISHSQCQLMHKILETCPQYRTSSTVSALAQSLFWLQVIQSTTTNFTTTEMTRTFDFLILQSKTSSSDLLAPARSQLMKHFGDIVNCNFISNRSLFCRILTLIFDLLFQLEFNANVLSFALTLVPFESGNVFAWLQRVVLPDSANSQSRMEAISCVLVTLFSHQSVISASREYHVGICELLANAFLFDAAFDACNARADHKLSQVVEHLLLQSCDGMNVPCDRLASIFKQCRVNALLDGPSVIRTTAFYNSLLWLKSHSSHPQCLFPKQFAQSLEHDAAQVFFENADESPSIEGECFAFVIALSSCDQTMLLTETEHSGFKLPESIPLVHFPKWMSRLSEIVSQDSISISISRSASGMLHRCAAVLEHVFECLESGAADEKWQSWTGTACQQLGQAIMSMSRKFSKQFSSAFDLLTRCMVCNVVLRVSRTGVRTHKPSRFFLQLNGLDSDADRRISDTVPTSSTWLSDSIFSTSLQAVRSALELESEISLSVPTVVFSSVDVAIFSGIRLMVTVLSFRLNSESSDSLFDCMAQMLEGLGNSRFANMFVSTNATQSILVSSLAMNLSVIFNSLTVQNGAHALFVEPGTYLESNLTRVFDLLRSPSTELAISVHGFLRTVLKNRISAASLDSGSVLDQESLRQLTLSVTSLKQQAPGALKTPPSLQDLSDSENESEHGGSESSDVQAQESAFLDSDRLYLSVEQLLPPQLLQLLMPVAYSDVDFDQVTSVEPFRLRAYFLGWGLLLESYRQLPADSQTLIGTFIRGWQVQFHRKSHDVFSLFMRELVEHILISKSWPEFLSVLKDSSIQTLLDQPLTVHLLQPCAPHGSEKAAKHLHRFSSHLEHSDDFSSLSVFFGHLPAALYLSALDTFPSITRLWFSQCDRSTSTIIAKLTSLYFAPILIRRQIESIRKSTSISGDDTLSVRGNVGNSEILAEYTKDEIQLVLRIKLSPSFPLHPADVSCLQRAGIEESRARRWLLTVSSMINAQNNAIACALELWKRSVDKIFEGVEECPICYSVLHASNSQLPRMTCRTCQHKFHANCLYKWFTTNHTASCPLCRSIF